MRKNRKLYRYVRDLNNPYIKALPYIESKTEMNRLYAEASGIITKPGGVTISECIENSSLFSSIMRCPDRKR